MSQRLTLINLSAMSRRGLGKRCSFYFTRVVNSLQFEQLVAENCGGVAVLHHRLGDIGEPLMRLAGMGPQQGQGLLHIHITAFSQHTLACSITTRVLRAIWSCSLITSARVKMRWCRIPTVATSARA